MSLVVSEISQADDRVSMSFFFQSSLPPDPFPGIRCCLLFFDHRVQITCSSTCTSLTPNLVPCVLCKPVIDRAGVDVEKESLLFGEEQSLPSRLICVAMSLLETSRDISVAAFFTPSSFSSATYAMPEEVDQYI